MRSSGRSDRVGMGSSSRRTRDVGGVVRRPGTTVSLGCAGCHTRIVFEFPTGMVGAVGTCENCGRTFRLAGGRLTEAPSLAMTDAALRHVS